jgi:hypothetical protein
VVGSGGGFLVHHHVSLFQQNENISICPNHLMHRDSFFKDLP